MSATPFNLNKYIVVGAYVVVLCISPQTIFAVEPMKLLISSRNIFPDLAENEVDVILTDAFSVGISASLLSALLTGFILDYFGPKVAAIMGQLLVFLGYVLLFFGPIDIPFFFYTGCLFIGMGFLAILVPHLSIAALFGDYSLLILAIFGGAVEISLFSPTIMLALTNFYSVQFVVAGFLFIMCLSIAIDVFLLPSTVYELIEPAEKLGSFDPTHPGANPPRKTTTMSFTRTLSFASSRAISIPMLERASSVMLGSSTFSRTGSVLRQASMKVDFDKKSDKSTLYHNTTLIESLKLPYLWALTIAFCICFFRKIHFAQTINSVFIHIGEVEGRDPEDVQSLLNVYRWTLPIGLIPSVLIGWVCNSFGIIWGQILVLCVTIIVSVTYAIPVFWLQYISIIFNVVAQSYITGILFASIVTIFGYRFIGVLQGIANIIAGVLALFYPIWNRYVVLKLSNILISNWILFIMCGCCLTVPLFLQCTIGKSLKESMKSVQIDDVNRGTSCESIDIWDDKRSESSFDLRSLTRGASRSDTSNERKVTFQDDVFSEADISRLISDGKMSCNVDVS